MENRETPRPLWGVSIIVFAMLLFVVGCSNALNYEVAGLTDHQRISVRRTLTADQLENLDDWISRNTTATKSLPPGVTVEQALMDQAGWLAKQQIEQAKANESRNKVLVERAAKQRELSRMLSVAIIAKRNKVQENEEKVVALNIAYDNKTDEDIRAVKGVFKFTDIYGESIIDIRWSYDDGISARQTAVQHDALIGVNKLMQPQVKLWDTDFEKLKSIFEVNTIIFRDGKRVNATE